MNRSNSLATIYIVRHGETEWNVTDRIQGQFDSSLTKKGIEQAKQIGNKLRHISFDAIFSSDLLRAKRTAEIIKLDRQLEIITRESLRERSFGRFHGKSSKEYKEETKELLDEYQKLSEREQWKFKFDSNYESDEELASRFITLLQEVAAAYPNKTVLIVTHGGPIRTFLAHCGFAKMSELQAGSFKNAGYLKIQSDGIDFFIKEVEGYQKK
jgi:probable phosphoglycerate mutase